tara:strand:- start:2596 stop:3057 length:462 start_codon:yes stop_codon:yes gene_type:complete
MFRQSLIDSLQTIFPNISWSGIQGLTPGRIAGGFADEYDIDPQDLPESLFQPLSQSLFKAAEYKTYAPMLQSEGESFLTDLTASMQGADVTRAYGGFAGSAQSKRKEKQVKDVYGKAMGDVYSNIRGMQTEALQGIQSEVDKWHEASQSIKGY